MTHHTKLQTKFLRKSDSSSRPPNKHPSCFQRQNQKILHLAKFQSLQATGSSFHLHLGQVKFSKARHFSTKSLKSRACDRKFQRSSFTLQLLLLGQAQFLQLLLLGQAQMRKAMKLSTIQCIIF